MKSNIRSYIKYLAALPMLLWLFISLFLVWNFPSLNEDQKGAGFLTLVFIFPFLMGFPIYTLRSLKTLKLKKETWTVFFPYKKQKIQFRKEDIQSIKMIRIDKIPIKYSYAHDVIKIKLKNGKTIQFNSLENSHFSTLKNKLNRDYKNLIKN